MTRYSEYLGEEAKPTIYAISTAGYLTRTMAAMSETAARQIYAQGAGWHSDHAGYWDFIESLNVTRVKTTI